MFSLPPTVVAGSAPVLQLSVDPLWFVAAIVGVFLVGAIVGPLVALSFRETRDPTAEERDRLADLTADLGEAPQEVRVTDAGGDRVEVSIRGPPGRRSLVVSGSVLDDLDETTAAALLAAEHARARVFYIEYRAVAAAVVLGIATAMFGGLVSFSDGLFLVAVAALVLFWVGRRLQFRADRGAAAMVGAATLAEAFETAAALEGVEPDSATWRTWFEVQPPLGQRIDRLRESTTSP